MGNYKLSEVCRIIGVTRRALQGYDEIGLLNPTDKTQGGYWLYDDRALDKLALIQIFVEIGYSRFHIKEILNNPDLDLKKEYSVAIEALQHKKEKIDQMINLLEVNKEILSLPTSVTRPLEKIDAKKVFHNASFSELTKKNMELLSKTAVPNKNEIRQQIRWMVPLMEIGYLNGEDPTSPEVQGLIEPFLDAIIELAEEDQNIFLEGKDKIPDDIIRLIFAKSINLVADEILADKDFQEWTTLAYGKGAAEFMVKAIEVYCELHLDVAEKYEIDLNDLRLEDTDA